MNNDQNAITVGQRVTFDDEKEGALKGTVLNIQRDITNGCRTAWVEIDHELPGICQNVQVHKLQPMVSERMH